MPSSRETIAAWQVIPPVSVTTAPARRSSGTQSGVVVGATRISPSPMLAPAGSMTIRAGPSARPGAAPSPRRRSSPAASGPASCGASSPSVVTGRDCSIQIFLSASIAHSVSWGEP